MPPGNDVSGTRLPEFLSDFGRAAVGSASTDERVLELMRAASDPLLLRATLFRASAEGVLENRLSPPGLLVGLDTLDGGRPTDPGRRHFDVEPLFTPSLHPEHFVPTEEEGGLTVSMTSEDGVDRGTGLAVAFAVALVFMICLPIW